MQAERGSRPTRRHPCNDPRDDVDEDVGVGVVECGLYIGTSTQCHLQECLQPDLTAISPWTLNLLVEVAKILWAPITCSMIMLSFFPTEASRYQTLRTWYSIVYGSNVELVRYRPPSRADNTFGSVRVCVCPSVCLWALSCLNRLTFYRDFWHDGRPWPWLAWGCRPRS